MRPIGKLTNSKFGHYIWEFGFQLREAVFGSGSAGNYDNPDRGGWVPISGETGHFTGLRVQPHYSTRLKPSSDHFQGRTYLLPYPV